MRCQWQELMDVLPGWLRSEIDPMESACLQEIRLRLDAPPELVTGGRSTWLRRNVTREDLHKCINTASRYSPWAASTVAKGYITGPGGHRIGMCGQAVIRDGSMTGIREVTSLNIRVARDIPGIANGIRCTGSILILGAPGWGKTTLLRDLIRRISNGGAHVAVVDERGELFPPGAYPAGKGTDVLSDCGKPEGVETVLRTMGPDWIAVDEITGKTDCDALIRTGWCGVRMLATAHAGSIRDLQTREVYRPLLESRLFSTVVVLRPDKTWIQERMDI